MSEMLATTEHQFDQMHQRFMEAERIWKEEFTSLADRLNEQQRVLPYALLYKVFSSVTFGELVNSCAHSQIFGAVMEALEMVKEDYLDVDVAQSRYGYSVGANDRADMELAWAILNPPPQFRVVDSLINHDGLVTSRELPHSGVDADEDYARLAIDEGWVSRIDPRRMGLIQEPVVDPNLAGSSGGVLACPSRTEGRVIPPAVLAPSVPPPNVITCRRQPPEEALDAMEEDAAPIRNEVFNISLGES